MMEAVKVFSGSYLNGCEVDLINWCGLELTDDQTDKLWDHLNETTLLEEAGADLQIEEEFEGGPGASDTFYSVYAEDVEGLKAELREFILSKIG